MVYELLTGYPLFPILSSTRECVDDCHLLSMIDQLGPLPEHIFSQWPRSNKYFHSDGEPFNSLVSGTEILLIKSPSLETRFHEEKPSEINENEEKIVLDLVLSALSYEPEKRLSAKEMLCHPWFCDEFS